MVRGGTAMMCLHPRHGYGVLLEGAIRRLDGTAQLFGLGPRFLPVIRTAGVREGSVWEQGMSRHRGVAIPYETTRVDVVVLAGVPCVHLRGEGESSVLLVALHGGPDSHEWDDLRYGGAYRELLAAGVDILIVNYPGSRDLGVELHRRGRVRWWESTQAIVRAVRQHRERHFAEDVALLGVSFGAWLAAQVADAVGASAVVALSPILRLADHLDRHARRDPAFSAWAEERFGDDHADARAGDRRVRECRVPGIAIVPAADEVVRSSDSADVAQQLGWEVVSVEGSHYPSTREEAARRWRALLDATCRPASGGDGMSRPLDERRATPAPPA